MRLLLGIAWMTALASAADAQFINRAVWLGDEREPFRRDYEQDAEYFLDRAAYVDAPPWWSAAGFEPFTNRIAVSAGSVSSSELTLEAAADVGVELGRGFTARVDYLQSEHQTTQFERIALGLDLALSDGSALFMQVEGTPEKSRADLSLGL